MATVEVISTGTELLQGLYPDTNAQYLSQWLGEKGFLVRFHTAVRDDAEATREALGQARRRVDIVLISGGLGPTTDDVVREVASRVYGMELKRDEQGVARIRDFYVQRGVEINEEAFRQAEVPEGARPLYNEVGTAMGFIIPGEEGSACCIALPGPRREFEPMLESQILPYLQERYPGEEFFATRVVRSYGIPEVVLHDQLRDLISPEPGVELAFLAREGKIDLRINAEARGPARLKELLRKYEEKLVERVGRENVYGFDEQELEFAVGEELMRRGLRIAVAESCTGGLVSMRLTNVPGSSAYLFESYVVYSNEAKTELLGVKKATLESHGAVSVETALEMAVGVRERAQVDIGLSITGIAGPTGGTEEKPVGLVFVGLTTREGSRAFQRRFPGNRWENRWWSSDYALDLVRRLLLNELDPVGIPGKFVPQGDSEGSER